MARGTAGRTARLASGSWALGSLLAFSGQGLWQPSHGYVTRDPETGMAMGMELGRADFLLYDFCRQSLELIRSCTQSVSYMFLAGNLLIPNHRVCLCGQRRQHKSY